MADVLQMLVFVLFGVAIVVAIGSLPLIAYSVFSQKCRNVDGVLNFLVCKFFPLLVFAEFVAAMLAIFLQELR